MISKGKKKAVINKEVYKMKNEFLMTLRYFFETHADPLPPCAVDWEDIDADVRAKRGYVSFGDFDDKKTLTYVYADCFENVVAKGYPLESVIKVLKDHGILTYVGRLADYYGIEGKVYEIQEHVLEDKLKIFTADEMLRKLMLITMLTRRKLENALSRMAQLSPRQLEEENAMGKIRWSICEAQSMAGGVDELFSKAKKLLQILEEQ